MRRLGRWLRRLLVLGVAGGVLAGAGMLAFLQHAGTTPRALGPYLERRASGHNPTIEAAGRWLRTALVRLDREPVQLQLPPALRIGAQALATPAPAGRAPVVVADDPQARQAIDQAQAGDSIVLLPGTYHFHGAINVWQHGRADAPIVVRAHTPGSVVIEFDAEEGFKVGGRYWRFENLVIKGVCKEDTDCEHAFHIWGEAAHFTALNNQIVDFNAHFKINGWDGKFPDFGVIDGNTLRNTRVRNTGNPVTPVDLVGANGWTVRRNLIADFFKGEGDHVSYGAFFKGGGRANVFEQNIVVCEQFLHDQPGQRIGLSLGGGGTDKGACRDKRCISEQEDGVLRANLIVSCSDDGIYINNAARSRILHNTLIDTGGIEVRFPGSSADVEGNLVDGAIRSRNQGVLRAHDNLDSAIAWLYLGRHVQRERFSAPAAFDFSWAGGVPRRAVQLAVPDLCQPQRASVPAYGAFEDFNACLLGGSAR